MLTPEERGQAEAIMRQVKTRQARIDADANLSTQGKQSARAREQLAGEQALRELTTAADARHKQAVRDAHYRAFGLKTTSADAVMADRDARQFAAGLKTPAEAARALAAADLRGDVSMSRAIAERAWGEQATDVGGHWGDVLGVYAADNPDRERSIAEYSALTGSEGRAARFSDNLFRHVPRPADLRQGSIEALAAQGDDQASAG